MRTASSWALSSRCASSKSTIGVRPRSACSAANAVGGLRNQGCGVEAGHLPERGNDVVEHAADPDGGVGQVDHHVPGGVQRGRRGPHGDRLARTDLTGDHSEGVLVDAPADPRDGFGVPVVAVQHRRGEAATEGHPGESPVVL